MNQFATTDSGERMQFDSGMKRDTAEGKPNWLLVRPGPMLARWVALMTRGSVKYESDRQPGELRNWQKAEGIAEYERFLESAARHFEQYLTNSMRRMRGETIEPDGHDDGKPFWEDHGAATFFNINGAEYVWERMQGTARPLISAPDGLPEGWLLEVCRGEWTLRRFAESEKPSYDETDTQPARMTLRFEHDGPCCGDPSDCTGCPHG